KALRRIEQAGRGVFLYVVGQESHDILLGSLSGEASERHNPGLRPRESGFRDFGRAAQVLKSIGVESIEVLTDNPRKIVGLEGFGIDVAGSKALTEKGEG